jgi:hypothetical protein
MIIDIIGESKTINKTPDTTEARKLTLESLDDFLKDFVAGDEKTTWTF